jgi:hypothetical protein
VSPPAPLQAALLLAVAATSACTATATGDAHPSFPAGNPDFACTSLPIPSQALPADVSHPTTVVGTGTPASCTFAALDAAVRRGGVVTFDCGPAPVTIPVTATLTPPTSNAYAGEPPVDTVLDGGNRVTLDGGGAVRLLSFVHAGSWRKNLDALTLQHLVLAHGKATGTQAIPACTQTPNDGCSTGWDDGQGGALLVRDGQLRIVDVTFTGNEAALLGPDTGGGAVYVVGTATPVLVLASTFRGNRASNGGAFGMLWAGAAVLDSVFDGNAAVGEGANSDDPTRCACVHAGQHQVGSGGNGGTIYKDGADDADVTVCGTRIRGGAAQAFGGAVFLTADGSTAKLRLLDSVLEGNTSPFPYWQWCPGVSTDNPHVAGSSTSSPSPQNTTFCDAAGKCTSTCGS